ncbi:MAG: hypothetical protein IPK46_01755 [Saprospiraceae bacterium]|nr:hypothetical protein [Saprospiraceae bacterium]
MKKYFNSIILVFVLIGLPLGSYFYLRQGFTFRKNLIDELKTSMPLKGTLTDSGYPVLVKGRCTVIALNENHNQQLSLFDQFKDAKGFQLAGNMDTMLVMPYLMKKQQVADTKNIRNYFQIDSTVLSTLKQAYPASNYLILDTLGKMRYSYSGNENDMKKLAGHITVLLPLYKEK